MPLADPSLKPAPSATEEAAAILRTVPPRICDVLERWVKEQPDHPALVESGNAWTYAQFATAVTDTAAWLTSLGVRPGDRVMLIGENCRAFVTILLALASLDAWPVLVNAKLSAREVDEIREHSGARRLIYTTSVSVQAREHAKRHGATLETPAHIGSLAVSPLNDNTEPEAIDPDPASRVAALIYTSGTTGRPKGVMLTHRGVLFVAAGSAKIRSLSPSDRLYGVLPMSHAVGLSVVLLGSLLSGATLYLTSRFDPVAAVASIEKENLTVLLGVPATFVQFLEYARLRKIPRLKHSALRIISSSGAPLFPTVKLAAEQFFGLVLHNGYGISEASPNVAQTRVDSPRSDNSVGPAFPGVELKLLGAAGNPVGDGEVGELWVRGPNIMKGYYRAPDETAAVLDTAGWLNTRDLARLKSGNLFIVGRAKELIIRYGFNVYPAEIEAVLNSYPGVLRSAVVGRSIQNTGEEEAIAFVQVGTDMDVTVPELQKHAAQHLASYKQPTRIYLAPELPVTVSGKVIKHELLKMFGESIYRLIPKPDLGTD